jgi:CheY-like chemotaxis protein
MAPAEDAAVSPDGRGETVLVVEDDAAVRTVVAHLLSEGGYDVVAVASAAEALTAVEDCSPDLLLTDVVMPDLSGGDLATQLRRDRQALAVLFMSGYTDDVVMRHGLRERRIAFLEKPFTRTTLLAAVRHALNHRGGPEPTDD